MHRFRLHFLSAQAPINRQGLSAPDHLFPPFPPDTFRGLQSISPFSSLTYPLLSSLFDPAACGHSQPLSGLMHHDCMQSCRSSLLPSLSAWALLSSFRGSKICGSRLDVLQCLHFDRHCSQRESVKGSACNAFFKTRKDPGI